MLRALSSIVFLLVISFFSKTWARVLQLDETLIVRVLDVSESGRTILINRGEEHGIREGLHARFSTPQDGVFIRAAAIRVSPSRSVWSIYRLHNSQILREQLTATLKVVTPVRVTDDETRALGLLSEEYHRRVGEEIPREQEDKPRAEARPRVLDNHLIDEKVQRSPLHNGRDFSSLHSDTEFQRNPRINWESLDESSRVTRDRGQRSGVDYSGVERWR